MIRQWSSLTSKQKDETQKVVCKFLAGKYPAKYITPELWGVLFDVSFDEIMKTKEAADKLCKGKMFKFKETWYPLSLKDLK